MRWLIHGCGLLIPAVYFQTVGRFDETLRHTQDYDLFFKMLRVAPIHFCNHSLVLSRLHPEQNSRQDALCAQRLQEGNHLWSMFLSSLTDAEMMQMEKTPYLLLRRVWLHLSKSEYTGAADVVQGLAEKRLADTKISLVMPFFDNLKLTMAAIDAVVAQTHANFELILVNDGAVINDEPIRAKVAADSRLKYHVQKNSGYHAALAAGARMATGRYIVNCDVNLPLAPDALAAHLRCREEDMLQENPLKVC
jgi:Glycosyl transferase family 2